MAQGAEEETKAQISAVNSQKVSIVAEFMAHMRVLSLVNTEGSIYTDSMLHEICILKPFIFIQLSPSLFPSPAEDGEGVHGSRDRGHDSREDQAGD
jgi:hypothetical protein